MVKTKLVLDIEQAAVRLEKAQDDLHRLILEARLLGVSLRTIAEAARMSHESVRRVVQ